MSKITTALICMALLLSGINCQNTNATQAAASATQAVASATQAAASVTVADAQAATATTTGDASAPINSTFNSTLAALPYPTAALNQYIIEPLFYSTDETHQVISHHFCGANEPTGVIVCVLYDGRDPAIARLLGIEYVVTEAVFNTFDAHEKSFWHSHSYGVQSGNVIAPDLTGDKYTNTLQTIAGTYGKATFLWSQDLALPTGDPIAAFAFTDPNQFNATASQIYDDQTNTTAVQRAANNADITVPVPALGADNWDVSGQIPVYYSSDVSLPENLWGLVFSIPAQEQ